MSAKLKLIFCSLIRYAFHTSADPYIGYEKVESGWLSGDEIFLALVKRTKSGGVEDVLILKGNPDKPLQPAAVKAFEQLEDGRIRVESEIGILTLQRTLLNGIPVRQFPMVDALPM